MFKRIFEGTISAQAISNIVKELDSSVDEFRRKRFEGEYDCVYVDGLWITLSKPVKTKKVILLALGVRADGSKDLLSFQVASSESEAWWWGFLSDLKDRGLRGEQIGVIVSDGSAGLIKAITALYPHVRRQLCTFHKANDLGNHLSNRTHRNRIIADALHVFEGAHLIEVRKRLKKFIAKWRPKEPKAVRNFTKDFEFCLTFLEFSGPLKTMTKTNNPVERYIEEIRRRIIPMRAFNNSKSAERIIYGIIAVVLNKKQINMPYNKQIEITHNA
jgi:transposase-like protein